MDQTTRLGYLDDLTLKMFPERLAAVTNSEQSHVWDLTVGSSARLHCTRYRPSASFRGQISNEDALDGSLFNRHLLSPMPQIANIRRLSLSSALVAFADLFLILSLCIQIAVAQAPSITTQPVVDFITSGTARVVWTTSVSGSNHRIRWGTASQAYTQDRILPGSGSLLVTGSLSGLPPGAQLFARGCSTMNASETCSEEVTFSTPVSGQASLPEGVRSTVDTTRPVITGASRTVGGDCDHLSTGLLALWNASSYGDEIVIPPTTTCNGRYVFSGKTWPGPGNWIVIRSGGNLPPAGVRITPQFAPQMPSIVHANPLIPRFDTLPQAECDLGRLVWHNTEAAAFKLKQCRVGDSALLISSVNNTQDDLTITVPGHGLVTGDRVLIDQANGVSQANGDYEAVVVNSDTLRVRIVGGGPTIKRNGTWTSGGRVRKHVWQGVTSSFGATLPSTCATNTWFVLDGGGDIRHRAYWCTSPNKWQRTYLDNHLGNGDFANGAVFDFWQNGPQGVWLRGLNFTTLTIPTTEETSKGSLSSYVGNNFFGSLISTGGAMVVYEQNLFRPHELARTGTGLTLSGDNSFFIENWLEHVYAWRPAILGAAGDPPTVAIDLGVLSGGPMLIRNNYFSSIGVATIFSQDDFASSAPPSRRLHDLQIVRNEFVWPENFRVGSPEHLADPVKRIALGRHHIEFKKCRRCVIEGNIFRSTWASVNQGAAIALSSRCGSGKRWASCTNGTCNDSWPGFSARDVGERLAIKDQIVTVTSANAGSFTVSPAITASGEYWSMLEPAGVYDISLRHNRFENVTMPFYAIAPDCSWSTVSPLGPMQFSNNLVTIRSGFCGLDMRGADGTYRNWSCSASCTNDYPCWGTGFYVSGPMRDWTFESNSILGAPGNVPLKTMTFNFQNSDLPGMEKSGLTFRGNLVQSGRFNHQSTIFGDTSRWAKPLLDAHYPYGYTVQGNVFVDQQALPETLPYGPQPPGNQLYRIDQQGDVGFVDAGAGDYRLSSTSPLKGALNGRDPGVDFTALERAVSGSGSTDAPPGSPQDLRVK